MVSSIQVSNTFVHYRKPVVLHRPKSCPGEIYHERLCEFDTDFEADAQCLDQSLEGTFQSLPVMGCDHFCAVDCMFCFLYGDVCAHRMCFGLSF